MREPVTRRSLDSYFIEMAADLNFRLLCEAADSRQETAGKVSIQAAGKEYQAELLLPPEHMLWIESITVTGCETASQQNVKDRTEGKRQKPNRIASLWERIKNCLLGRKGKKKKLTNALKKIQQAV